MKDIAITNETYGLLLYLCDEMNYENFDELIKVALEKIMGEKK